MIEVREMTRSDPILAISTDQFVRHSVAEILVTQIAGEIFKRQDSNRFNTSEVIAWCFPQFRSKSISPLRESLNEPGAVGVIAQCLAQPVNGLVEAAVEIDHCARRPKDLLEFFPRQDLTWTL